LAQGSSAYGAQFIPNIKSYFVAKKAGNGYWFPPVAKRLALPEPEERTDRGPSRFAKRSVTA